MASLAELASKETAALESLRASHARSRRRVENGEHALQREGEEGARAHPSIVFGDDLDNENLMNPDDASNRPVDSRSRVAMNELLRDIDSIVNPLT